MISDSCLEVSSILGTEKYEGSRIRKNKIIKVVPMIGTKLSAQRFVKSSPKSFAGKYL
jgi:hypothetical protein